MKLTRLFIATTLVFAIGLWHQPEKAVADQESLNSEQFSQFIRALTTYPDFFQEGREQFEREIQRLYQRQNAEHEMLLKINLDLEAQRESLQQIQPRDFPRVPQNSHI
ncbi:MAG: hypothetical protein RIE73_09075 [Coleofasciculus sp. C1-SOL-03]|jgi:hypothetical protein|uniref:hypothetical protein n=1 Tax=Coleofasciculus sp. C1-SOL-03 TaxID=3069522 RepID=UPI0032FF38E9